MAAPVIAGVVRTAAGTASGAAASAAGETAAPVETGAVVRRGARRLGAAQAQSETEPRAAHKPKFSTAEIVLIMAAVVLLEIVGVILLIVGVGIAPYLLDIILFPVTQLYFRFKHVRGTVALIGNLINLIPIVGDISFSRTISIGLMFYADRHPDSFIGKAVGLAQVAKPVSGGAQIKTPKITA